MRIALMITLAILVVGTEASAQQPKPKQPSTTVLKLTEASQPRLIEIQATVDQQSFATYWTQTFDAIFGFADVNQDGVLSEKEVRLVPSARAIRLSLGNAFTPPVAAIQSLSEIVADPSQKCSKQQLRQYYLSHGAGQLQIGSGELPHTAALTAALVQALDADKDQRLSQIELQRAEAALRRLDTNDDELIGVGELVPNATYPGSWAAHALQSGKEVDLSTEGHNLVLQRLKSDAPGSSDQKTIWQIMVADQLADQSLNVASSSTRFESWSIPGPINELFAQLREEIASAAPELPQAEKKEERSRDRRPSRAWLTPLADRDGNGTLSQQEIDHWLKLQQQLIHGQLLVSIYSGGGLFELLDTNHDAGLSIRELRNMWYNLKSAGCTSGSHVDLKQVPHVILFVVSQGYPDQLGQMTTSDVEWFRLMDRNRDGDVSRREFTGPPTTFDRLDQDHDSLISPQEAAKQD